MRYWKRVFALSITSITACGDIAATREACVNYCYQPAKCDKEKGILPSSTCSGACLDFVDVVNKNKACAGETSCDYAVCFAAAAR